MTKLLYVGQQVANDLKDRIAENIPRYRDGDFLDMEVDGDWRIPLSIQVDIEQLSKLNTDKSASSEIQNSLLVGCVFSQVTPALARENRMWVRLSHIECLQYSRERWLSPNKLDSDLEEEIRKHLFAATLTQCRDDHSIARLWWNYQIARQMMPENPARALDVMLARADIRMNLIERPGLGARPKIGSGVIRALERNNELLRQEHLFREFMKRVNLLGAGVAFEVWSDTAVDGFMSRCMNEAAQAT